LKSTALVIPAKAGIQGPDDVRSPWVPAFAGTTAKRPIHCKINVL
jgi:hypothetical protein